MKIFIIRILQLALGFERYLYLFSKFIIVTLKWNRREKDFLYFVSLLPDSGSVIDAGANIGAMTTHLARRLKNSTVFSFEPVPYNIRTLKKIVAHYRLKNVMIMETALGSADGEVEMLLPTEKKVRRHGLSYVVNPADGSSKEGEHFKVPVRKLDTITEIKNAVRITGIKLDVENYEFFVLEGALELIKKHHPIIYSELWDNENRTKCFDLLTGAGYSISIQDQGKLYTFDPGRHRKQNFFFIPAKQN